MLKTLVRGSCDLRAECAVWDAVGVEVADGIFLSLALLDRGGRHGSSESDDGGALHFETIPIRKDDVVVCYERVV